MAKEEISNSSVNVYSSKFTEIYIVIIQMIMVEYTHRVLRTPFHRVHNSQLTRQYSKLSFSVTFNTEKK